MEQEDYLETIYKLKKENGYVRISDVAAVLGLSKPSVTQMMQRLKKDGLVLYDPYKPLDLSDDGMKIGKEVAERHKVLAEFFTLIGIPEKVQDADIHGIEHCLSSVTLGKLKKVTKFLREKGF